MKQFIIKVNISNIVFRIVINKLILIAILLIVSLNGNAQNYKGKIIFTSNANNLNNKELELYVVNPSGQGLKQLTFDAVSNRKNGKGKLSPNGKYFTFHTYKYGGYKLAISNSDFTSQRKLSKGPQYSWGASWSTDSKKIVYATIATNRAPYFEGNVEIFKMNIDGSSNINLSDSSAEDYAPSWSPDGNRILFYSNRTGSFDIYTMDSNGNNVKNLTNTPNFDEFAPSWSPNGNKIAFHRKSSREDKQYVDTYIMDYNGKNPINLTNNIPVKRNLYSPYFKGAAPTYAFETCWSPEGNEIVYASKRTGNFEIFIIKINNGQIRQLTRNGGLNMYPFWVK